VSDFTLNIYKYQEVYIDRRGLNWFLGVKNDENEGNDDACRNEIEIVKVEKVSYLLCGRD
jgi:hypothetical protein